MGLLTRLLKASVADIPQAEKYAAARKALTMADLVKLESVPDENANFFVVRRGAANKVGMPTREFNPEHYGAYVYRPDIIDPDYLFYALQHLHQQGRFQQAARGSTGLQNIRMSDLYSIPFGARDA
jgi:hypothetical protein